MARRLTCPRRWWASAARAGSTSASRSDSPGSARSPPAAGSAWAGTASTAAAPTSSGRSSSSRSTPAPAARAGVATSASTCSRRPSSPSARRSSRPGSCRRSPAGEELWCQGYSEPDAGSDLAAVRTTRRARRRRVADHRPEGLDLARARRRLVLRAVPAPTRRAASTRGSRTCSCPMRQPGVEVRPIVQLTGDAEFNEVFFDGAGHGRRPHRRRARRRLAGRHRHARLRARRRDPRPAARLRPGARAIVDRRPRQRARSTIRSSRRRARAGLGRAAEPAPHALRAPRLGAHALAAVGGEAAVGAAGTSGWASSPWTCGPGAAVAAAAPYGLTDAQRMFLFTRADTIYGGSDEIQRNIIANHLLGRS